MGVGGQEGVRVQGADGGAEASERVWKRIRAALASATLLLAGASALGPHEDAVGTAWVLGLDLGLLSAALVAAPAGSRRSGATTALAVACALAAAFLGAYFLVSRLRASSPGAMAAGAGLLRPAAAVSSLLAGLSILASLPRARVFPWLSQALALAVATGSLMSLVLRLYGAAEGERLRFMVSLPLAEAFAFFLCAAGCLALLPGDAWMRALSDPGPPGMMLRRLLPFTLGIPVFVGWVRLGLQRVGVIGTELGLTWVVTTESMGMTLVAWLASRTIRTLETSRRASEAALRAAAKRYRDTMDSLLEGCQVVGRDGRYLYVNDAAAAQARRRKEDLLGRTPAECYPGFEGTELHRQIGECMRERIPGSAEHESPGPDGSSLWFHVAVSPVPEGVFVLSLDISERKREQAMQARAAQRLEEEVRRRTAQLQEANSELEAFTYSVSHDLRAPLRHVTGFADLLLRHAGRELDEKGRRYLDTMSRAAVEMGKLMGELLDLSRIGRAEIRKVKVDLAETARSVIAGLPAGATERGVRFELGALPVVPGEPALLLLVMRNLVENAVKYTRRASDPLVTIGSERSGGEVRVWVRDNGVGFDPRYQDKLFRVFQRLHRSDEFEGTGVGLASVRRIVSRHGGRTWAEGEPGKGACFWFALPDEGGSDG